MPDGTWEILSQTRGRLMPGEVIAVDPTPPTLTLPRKEGGNKRIQLWSNTGVNSLVTLVNTSQPSGVTRTSSSMRTPPQSGR